jgi:hypothetical protein
MKIIHIEGNDDGNCLFRSCSYHIGVDYKKIRHQVSNVILNYPYLPINGSSVSEWLEWIGHDYIEYSKYISKNGVYGSGIELMLISIMYRCCIKVMNSDFDIIAEYFPEFGNSFYLLFSGDADNGHYDPLE